MLLATSFLILGLACGIVWWKLRCIQNRMAESPPLEARALEHYLKESSTVRGNHTVTTKLVKDYEVMQMTYLPLLKLVVTGSAVGLLVCTCGLVCQLCILWSGRRKPPPLTTDENREEADQASPGISQPGR